MKKVLAAALICAVSTFAAWDKFPVIGLGKGESNLSFYQARQGNEPDFGLDFKIRYSPLQNLELMSKLNGIGGNHIFGLRYQIIPVLSAGVDVGVPIPEKGWTIYPNAQFSMNLTPILSLGSNLGVSIYTQRDMEVEYGYSYIDVEYSRGLDLDAGVELDLSLGKSVIWLSFDLAAGITHSEAEPKNVQLPPDYKKELSLKQEGAYNYRGLLLMPSLGYLVNVSDNLSVGTYVGLTFGEKGKGFVDADTDNKFVTTIGMDASVKF